MIALLVGSDQWLSFEYTNLNVVVIAEKQEVQLLKSER